LKEKYSSFIENSQKIHPLSKAKIKEVDG